MGTTSFSAWYRSVTSFEPYPWQKELAENEHCENHLIRIPTGLGKTQGILATWAWNRLYVQNSCWPRRLVWVLPMRSLVEQTIQVAQDFLEQASFLGDTGIVNKVAVYPLMGGNHSKNWMMHPEQSAVLIGTQDMLISRALNRGYAASRASWPMAFSLLHHDCLWVMDEVQLMGESLSTTAQLDAFWRQHRDTALRPRISWWMSATLQPRWFKTPESEKHIANLENKTLVVSPKDQTGELWEANRKPTQVIDLADANDKKGEKWVESIFDIHQHHAPDPTYGRLTLVVVNQVKTAMDLFKLINKKRAKDCRDHCSNAAVNLIHSRFRPLEKKGWAVGEKAFIGRSFQSSETNQIIIATQVVEAGVDMSASALVTQLAPWPSLVQRFGRSARYGGKAEVYVVDRQLGEKKTAPYLLNELESSLKAIKQLDDVSLRSLEDFETKLKHENPQFLSELYAFAPLHILTQREFKELFDTTPDLTGADLDISRYIRSGDDRNVFVFWRDIPNDKSQSPMSSLQPHRDELCPVPIGDAKTWIEKLSKNKQPTWVWDYLDNQWIRTQTARLCPGQVVLVDVSAGGYDPTIGFDGSATSKKKPSFKLLNNQPIVLDPFQSDTAQDRENSNQISHEDGWKTIATHSREAMDILVQLAETFGISNELLELLKDVLRYHDWGKSHPAFSCNIASQPSRNDLAKAPTQAWQAGKNFYNHPTLGHRKGFRHELASCLALLELLRGADPYHDALLAKQKAFIELGIITPTDDLDSSFSQHPLAQKLAKLTEQQFNLLAYLTLSHHGKIRGSIQSSPIDQAFPSHDPQYQGAGQPIRGLREGDQLPSIKLPCSLNDSIEMPELTLHLDLASIGLSKKYGQSWAQRTEQLHNEFGPFTLSFYETLVRLADIRASQLTTSDPLLTGVNLTIATPLETQKNNAKQEVNLAR